MVIPMKRVKKKIDKIIKHSMVKHRHKKSVLLKFLILFAVIIAYSVYLFNEFGVEQGLLISGLTWSVFVFCVPFAASDILVGLPLRALFNVKLMASQIFVWVSGFVINSYAFLTSPETYQTTPLLQVFHYIISNPVPYWTILGLCGFGTFLSVLLADDVLDDLDPKKKKEKHSKKLETLFLVILIGIALVYYTLLSELDISLSH
jgi:hypothetical protein